MNPLVTFSGLEELKANFGDRLVNDAVRATLNKVARQARTQLSRDIREIYNVKAAAVTKATTLRPASGGGMEAFIFSTGQRIPLRDFGARQTGMGVSVQVKRRQKRRVLPGRFIVKSIGGNVFERRGEKRRMRRGRYVGQLKQPIVKLVGPSIPQMVKGQETLDRVLAYAREITPKIFQQEFNFRINRVIDRGERIAAQRAIR